MRKNKVISEFYSQSQNNMKRMGTTEKFDVSGITAIRGFNRIRTKLTEDLLYYTQDDRKLWQTLYKRDFNRNHKNYKKMIKEFDRLSRSVNDWCDKHEKMFDDGYKGDYKTTIESVDKVVDVRKTEPQKVFNDVVYSHIRFLNEWKEDLLEIIGGIKLGCTFTELFTWLGYALNKWESKENNILDLMNFCMKHTDTKTGVNLFERHLVDQWDIDWKKYRYRRVNGKLFSSVTRMEHDGMYWREQINTFNDGDSFPIYRAVSDTKHMIGFSWSPSLDTVFDWGTRNSEDNRFYIGKTIIRKKDILIWNMWSREYGSVQFDNFCEVILPPNSIKMENFEITEWDFNKKASVIKKQMKSYDTLVHHRRRFINWYNRMCEGYQEMCIERRSTDPLVYEKMPKELLNKIWAEVSKQYDTDDLYDFIGREKTFSIDPQNLKLTGDERNWCRQNIHPGFISRGFKGEVGMDKIGIKIPYTES